MTMKSFNFGESNVFTIIDKDSNVWFQGFDVASILGYAKPRNAILMHVDSEDKHKRGDFLNRLIPGRLEKNEKNETMINEIATTYEYNSVFLNSIPNKLTISLITFPSTFVEVTFS